jgi:hypothetical protein
MTPSRFPVRRPLPHGRAHESSEGAIYFITACALGIRWQRDFFDHRLRRDESFDEKALYINRNPVRAELCAPEATWPYAWRMSRFG